MIGNKEFKLIKFQPKRTFGVELEFGEGSNRSFLQGCIEQAGEPAISTEWRHDSNNRQWVCKTDSSCGFEIASRVLGSHRSIQKTLSDLNVLVRVCKILRGRGARINDRCGTHVHVCVGDFHENELLKLLYYWVKFEKTIVDMFPARRKRNSYCPCPSGFLQPNVKFSFNDLLSRGFHQRGSLNWNLYEQRETVEFRIAEGTTDPIMLKNWVRFLLYFVENVRNWPEPENVNWLTFEQCMSLLNFQNEENDAEFRILSPALAELREWVLKRTNENAGYRDSQEVKRKTSEWLQVIS